MTKLFIAIDFADTVTTALAHLQPPATAGLRLADPRQMHLTLHYVGQADSGELVSALTRATVPPFEITFEGVGQFRSPDGSTTLWAGVQRSAELLGLHSTIGAALLRAGFGLESRSYVPHVTIARCDPSLSAKEIDEFLSTHATFSLSSIPVRSYGLYSSTFIDEVPVYTREWQRPLGVQSATVNRHPT